MKQSKVVVVGLLAVTMLLVGYVVFTTVRANRLEQKLNRLEGSFQELQTNRALLSALISTNKLSVAQARVDLLRYQLGVPPSTLIEMRPVLTDVNSTPPATSK